MYIRSCIENLPSEFDDELGSAFGLPAYYEYLKICVPLRRPTLSDVGVNNL